MLRYSSTGTSIELLYLPLGRETRERVKPFIDGTVARMAQAVTAVLLLALAPPAPAPSRCRAGRGCDAAGGGLASRSPSPCAAPIWRPSAARSFRQARRQRRARPWRCRDPRREAGQPRGARRRRRAAHPRGSQARPAHPALVLYHRTPRSWSSPGDSRDSDRSDWLPLAEPLIGHAWRAATPPSSWPRSCPRRRAATPRAARAGPRRPGACRRAARARPSSSGRSRAGQERRSAALIDDGDTTLASLAAHYAIKSGRRAG